MPPLISLACFLINLWWINSFLCCPAYTFMFASFIIRSDCDGSKQEMHLRVPLPPLSNHVIITLITLLINLWAVPSISLVSRGGQLVRTVWVRVDLSKNCASVGLAWAFMRINVSSTTKSVLTLFKLKQTCRKCPKIVIYQLSMENMTKCNIYSSVTASQQRYEVSKWAVNEWPIRPSLLLILFQIG